MTESAIPSRREEESRIAASWLGRLEQVLADRDPGVFRRALHTAGIKASDLEAGKNIRLDQLDTAQLYARQHHPDITLRMYHASDLLDLGLIGYAMASSDTVRKALDLALNYHDVTSDRYQLQLIEHGKEARLRQLPFIEHLEHSVDMGEELAGLVRILESLLGAGTDFGEARVSFNFAAPGYVETYEEVFPCSCEFEAEHCEFVFPAAWLDSPVATANVSTSAVCASMCERVMGSGRMRSGTQEVVQRLLVSRVGRHMPTLEEAASALKMSAGQLRKRLYRESTTYKRIVLDVRMALARHYLQATSLSVQEVAYLLDYSQPAPFSRAFRAYYGIAPGRSRSA